MDYSMPSFPVLHCLPECPNSSPLSQWCHPSIFSSVALFFSWSQIFLSIRVFPIESALHIRQSKYWSFSFNISPSNEYSGLISFRIDWLDLLAIRETLKSLLQYHSSEVSVLQHSAFFVGPTLTCSHEYGCWKNYSFDYMGLCWQRSAFQYIV